MIDKLMIFFLSFFFPPGVFQSIFWGLGGILGLVFGESLIRVAGPTIAFRLFTMLAVSFIVVFTMGLRYVNFRDRNYYSVLLNTFNICVDATNTKRTNGGNASNSFQETNDNVQLPTSASFSEDNSH